MRRDLLVLAVALVLRAALDLEWLARDPDAFVELEETWNASVAWMALNGDLGGSLLALQYKEFCGGCSVVAALGTFPLAAGDSLLAWKSQAFLWTAGITTCGFMALRNLVGSQAAWAWAALMALPTAGASAFGLVLFGNHHEVQLFVLAALWAWSSGRPLAVGLLLTIGAWFCRTGLFGVPILLASAWAHRDAPARLGRLALGVGLGALVFLLPSGSDGSGYHLSSLAADPVGRLVQLFHPAVLGDRLFAGAGAGVGAVLLVSGLGGLAYARRPVLAGLAGAFALGFALVDVALPESRDVLVLMNGRYWGPWSTCLALGLAAGIGKAPSRWSLLAVIPLMVSSAATRPMDAGSSSIAHHRATDLAFFASLATHRLSVHDLADTAGATEREEDLLRLLEGIEAGRGLAELPHPIDGQLAFGIGLQFARERLEPSQLAEAEIYLTLNPEHQVDVGRGMAANVLAHTGPGDHEPWLQAALGRALVHQCGMKRDCLERSMRASPQPSELAWGYGLALRTRGEPPLKLNALAEAFGEHAGDFEDGLDHPLAGLDRPIGVDAPPDVEHRAPGL
ncbi:MAG: hypothetical protein GY913_09960 [Proteobacteria bacterium]|nr:hypothetical protein [Pseudomonadota bacterium]